LDPEDIQRIKDEVLALDHAGLMRRALIHRRLEWEDMRRSDNAVVRDAAAVDACEQAYARHGAHTPAALETLRLYCIKEMIEHAERRGR
jgi:hypothetical protein